MWAAAAANWYRSLVETKLLYALSSCCLRVAQLRRLDGFQAKCVRQIIGVAPSFQSRLSNKEVLKRAQMRPASEILLEQQFDHLGKILQQEHSSPLFACSLTGHLVPTTAQYVRRQGRPAKEWISTVVQAASNRTGLGLMALHKLAQDPVAWSHTVDYGAETAVAGVLRSVDASGAWTGQHHTDLLRILSDDGVCVLRGLYSKELTEQLTTAYMSAWSRTKEHMCADGDNAPKWQRRVLADCNVDPLTCADLYHKVPTMILDESHYVNGGREADVIRMGKGRYDFKTYMANTPLASDALLKPPPVLQALRALLGRDHHWIAYPGGLPAEGPCGNGRWHRDQLELFDREAISNEMQLPPVYFTMIAPLTKVGQDDGPTQFRIGSHKLIAPEEIRRTPLASTELVPGDAVLFNGRIVHRGSARSQSAGARHAYYVAFHKYWYIDDDFRLADINGWCAIEDVPQEDVEKIEEEEPWLKKRKMNSDEAVPN